MKPNFISEDEFKMLLANRDKVRGGVDRERAVVGVQASEKPGAAPDSPPSRVWVKPVSSPAPSPIFQSFDMTITGQLVSGKNQVQLLWRNGRVHKYPNKSFINWRANANLEIHEQLMWPPKIKVPVHLTCEYTPGDLRTRDVSGQLDALFHLLVFAKVLKDDGLVHDVTWRRQPMDRKQPRITLNLEAV